MPLLRKAALAASILLLASAAASALFSRPAPAPAQGYTLDASDLLLSKLAEDYAPDARSGERSK